MKSIAVAVMTVPSRQKLVTPLVLNHLPKDTQISVDGGGLWHNARKCWLANIEKGRDYCMVVQDDVEPVRDFMVNVWKMVQDRPTDVLSLFCSRMRDMDEALKDGASWVEYDNICWGQTIVLPTKIAKAVVEWSDQYVKDEWIMDDARVALWSVLNGHKIYCPVPTPLQHKKELKSTWADRDGSNLVSRFVGQWSPGPAFRPHQRGNKTFVETKSRWLKSS